jgi:hypothetical protein
MAKLELLSRTIYDADGAQTVWDFNFSGGYILPEHVKAYYELASVRYEVAVVPTMLVGPNQLYITPPIPAGSVLTIYRDTPKAAPLVDFVDRGTVSEVALDTIAKQAVFVAAESSDSAATGSVDVAVAAAAAAQASSLAAAASTGSAAAAALAAAGSAVASASSAASAAGTAQAAIDVYKAKQTRNLKADYGAVGDGVADDYPAMLAAWLECYPQGWNLEVPDGQYRVAGERNLPFKNPQLPVTSLLDCNNMTVFGHGPGTVLFTDSVAGADVFQLNGLKNFHVRNIAIGALVSGSDAGSNGTSVTGGFDNVTLDNVWYKDLGYVDKGTYVDGGKAVTLQMPSEANPILMGSFKATNIFADGCVYGFGYECDNDLALTQPVSIDVDIVVSNSRQGIVFSAGAANSTLDANSPSGIRVTAQTVNCMTDVVLSRTFGVDVDVQVVQTKTAAQLLNSFKGSKWAASDTVADVVALVNTYTRNSVVKVAGNKKDCTNKARIGAASEGSSGIPGYTYATDFYLDIRGNATGGDVVAVDSGGSIMENSRIYCTPNTTTSLPAAFYTPSRKNTLTIGPDVRGINMNIAGKLGWTQSDGATAYHHKYVFNGDLVTKQSLGSSGGIFVEKWLNHADGTLFGVRNDGTLAMAGRGGASVVTDLKGILPIYTEANVFYGYVPVYTSYTP